MAVRTRLDPTSSPQILDRARRAWDDGGFEAVFGLQGSLWRELEAGWPLEAPGVLYETLLRGDEGRKRRGAYYTPAILVDRILDEVLEPALRSRKGSLSSFSFCDPACGVGNFLIPAVRRVARRLSASTGITLSSALGIVKGNVLGVDLDPNAAELCRRALDRLCGSRAVEAVKVGDSLTSGPQWFRTSFEGFDLVLGNPPFVNAIALKNKGRLGDDIRHRYQELGGTADRSHYFLALASRIIKPEGWIGLVLPRAALCAPSAADLRRKLNPRFIELPSAHDLFGGAAVYICLLGCGPTGECKVVFGDESRLINVHGANWWRCIVRGENTGHDGRRLGESFEVTASMTAGEAYECLPFVVDSDALSLPKLLTTGLIDPGLASWGVRTCRYLGRRFTHPRLSAYEGFLPKRVDRARRPKIIVAGLSKRIECLLDPVGEFIGAVSTFTVTHPSNSLIELKRLAAFLNSPPATEEFRTELGANAMGGGSITMSRRFLEDLIIPDES